MVLIRIFLFHIIIIHHKNMSLLLLPSLHFSIACEDYDIPARIDFSPRLDSFSVCIDGGATRTFTSLRQTYNYFLLMYGHRQSMDILETMAKHTSKCQRIG